MQLMRQSSPDSDELHFYGDAEKRRKELTSGFLGHTTGRGNIALVVA